MFGKSVSAMFIAMGQSACHHRHIAFRSVIEDAPVLTQTVKTNQSDGIPGSGIPERNFVKNSYRRSPQFPLCKHRKTFLLLLKNNITRARNFLLNLLVHSDKCNVYLACLNHKTTCPKNVT